MIRTKMLKNREVCVIDENKSYIFNSSGICIKEDAGLIPQYTNGMVMLPLISVLSCNDDVDILVYVDDNTYKHFKSPLGASTIAMTLMKNSGYVRMLRRDGKQGNNSFNQLICLYPEGIDVMTKLSGLDAKEVAYND